MLLTHLLLFIASPLALARPTPNDDVRSLRTLLDKEATGEIGRSARAVNVAYCPEYYAKTPHLRLQPRARDSSRPQPGSHIITTSSESAFDYEDDAVDMSWYISHTPSTQTLTLAFSSFPDAANLINFLAYPENHEQPLVSLPDYILGEGKRESSPHIHSSYLYPLEDYGLPALLTILDILDETTQTPPAKGIMRYFQSHPSRRPIKRVEIVGHGLGAAIGLLVSLALEDMTEQISIHTTLFGLPRVGDQAFADLVDNANTGRMDIKRVTSYKDTMTHLPSAHFGVVHPTKGQIWISSDPRAVYACKPVKGGNEACSDSLELGKSSMMDHQGPYGGVWIGSQSCQNRE